MIQGIAIRLLGQFFKKALPTILKSKNTPEGRKALIKQLKRDAVEMAGVKGGTAIWEEVAKNSKISYENDKICIKYRKYKKCRKIKK